MDSLITAAARALAHGDPLGALDRVALRDDAPALALRGIAMSQLGDFARARALLRGAARAFGPRESLARARCAVAEAEVALAARDLGWPARALDAARRVLDVHGDHVNAAHAGYLIARHHLITGQLEDAERTLATLDAAPLPPALRAVHELVAAGIAIRRVRAADAHAALARAADAAQRAGIPALVAEVAAAEQVLQAPVAQRVARGQALPLRLDAVEACLASDALIVDACRMTVRRRDTVVALARRPVLFGLARALAQAWPEDVPRDALIATAFRMRHADDTHRARLRVEMGRLRQAVAPLAGIDATPRGFALRSADDAEVLLIVPPADQLYAPVLACLADGQSWSSSALALALGTSQRTVQRALDALAAAGQVQPVGSGRTRRWMTPPATGFATALLLPAPLPGA
ncbi:helix-turn-helix domain-containing protein [Cupriavidus sp. SZY C1]|uniref:helix-turn-helix domain-containing protein n=1 Tax=Cupriavidus sp. SZY C1 TaxID=3055037 RepID=UPI0028B93441|nr:helix-turn-helix domain-containing protein [Cupriavidus sp. SZY C1]MDT6964105.1 helix-turn-helix domain-containing protein [Cupriavidus sp. SZY C1]